jgi:hypothetical protein
MNLSDLRRAKMTLSLIREELLRSSRTEAAAGIETALVLVEDALGDLAGPSEVPTAPELPTPPPDPLARHTGIQPDGPPTRVEGSFRSPPAIAPATATVSGSGGPQNSYEVRMTPHPRAVGSCPDCGGQLNHAPTCPKLASPGVP